MTVRLYEGQRALRHRRAVAMRRGEAAVLDIGTAKIACLVLKFDAERAQMARRLAGVGELAGQNDLRVIGAATTQSRGIEFGEIIDMDEAEAAIRTAVQQAQKMAGVRLDHVIVTFSGGRPRSYGVHGEIDVEDGIVTEYEIGRLLSECDIPDYGEATRDAIHALPVNFMLDGKVGLKDPRGQIGNKLGVDMHLVTVGARSLNNTMRCIRRCDLELCDIAVSAYAAGLSALVEDEQELGAACIDMGAGTTGVSVFFRRQMIFADVVRLGGDHVTRDIAQALRAPEADCERLKTINGGLIATGMDDRDFLDVPNASGVGPGERLQVSRSELIGIIRPRVEEILEDVRAVLDASGFQYLPGQRVVLTGGASQLPGMEELATSILGRQTRRGQPLRVAGLPQATTGPAFSGVVGLALHTVHPQDECWDFEMPADHLGNRSLNRAIRWFKENW